MAAERYDVIIVDIPPGKRRIVVGAMLDCNLFQNMTIAKARRLTTNLPTMIVRCVDLDKAVTLELIFEVYGATIDIYLSSDCE